MAAGIVPTLTPVALLLLQVTIVLLACQLATALVQQLGQAPVIGQLLAGIVLGPSLFGLVLPNVEQTVFPSGSLTALSDLGQIGLVLYLFMVGAELDLGFVRRNFRSGAVIAVAGIVTPLAFGAILAMNLVSDPRLFPQPGHRWVGIVFMSAAMAVTALPVLARILTDHDLLATPLANLCLVSGSVSDVAAWALLAVALAGLSGPATAIGTLLGMTMFTLVIAVAVRRVLSRLMGRAARASELVRPALGGGAGPGGLGMLLVLLMLTAFFAELIGIHPAFGAFLFGTALAGHPRVVALRPRLEPLVGQLLLPIYFMYAGLHTSIGLIATPNLLLLTVVVVAVACLGKGMACTGAALLVNRPAREAVAVGAVMNARGIVELVILTIGLERGIITPTLFAIMVTMTIATTLIPSPVLRRLYRSERSQTDRRPAA